MFDDLTCGNGMQDRYIKRLQAALFIIVIVAIVNVLVRKLYEIPCRGSVSAYPAQTNRSRRKPLRDNHGHVSMPRSYSINTPHIPPTPLPATAANIDTTAPPSHHRPPPPLCAATEALIPPKPSLSHTMSPQFDTLHSLTVEPRLALTSPGLHTPAHPTHRLPARLPPSRSPCPHPRKVRKKFYAFWTHHHLTDEGASLSLPLERRSARLPAKGTKERFSPCHGN
ncbi:hypothetical protein E2C01_019702 [Portunus trituberculatus]|uniref:Uncharacterized protein n=1 Tax=Portunus trituberculatus TaxID=210409 RepID=A0A5B7DYN2_PORTR|nr:hypothetical protein [Portunus trituberculatus]